LDGDRDDVPDAGDRLIHGGVDGQVNGRERRRRVRRLAGHGHEDLRVLHVGQDDVGRDHLARGRVRRFDDLAVHRGVGGRDLVGDGRLGRVVGRRGDDRRGRPGRGGDGPVFEDLHAEPAGGRALLEHASVSPV
jgi:hypothetical protein